MRVLGFLMAFTIILRVSKVLKVCGVSKFKRGSRVSGVYLISTFPISILTVTCTGLEDMSFKGFGYFICF